MPGNVTEKHLLAVHHYEEGASWIVACRRAGYRSMLNINGKTVKRAFLKYARTLAAQDRPEEEEVLSPEIREAEPELDPDLVALEKLMEADDPSWSDMATHAKKALAKIAVGRIKAGAAQVASIKEIIARDEGKIGQVAAIEEAEDSVIYVVFLPTVDHAMGPIIHLGEISDIDPGDHIPGLTVRQAIKP